MSKTRYEADSSIRRRFLPDRNPLVLLVKDLKVVDGETKQTWDGIKDTTIHTYPVRLLLPDTSIFQTFSTGRINNEILSSNFTDKIRQFTENLRLIAYKVLQYKLWRHTFD